MRAEVELRLPVDPAYVSVLRATTVSLAARLDFTLDDIEDLRMAVSEATSLVLPHAAEDAELLCTFHPEERHLRVRVSARSVAATPPEPEEDFAWQVLSALTTHAELTTDDGHFAVTFTVHSTVDS